MSSHYPYLTSTQVGGMPQEEDEPQWFGYQKRSQDGSDEDWKILLQRYIERDKAQCESWNAEVENLLIFAGLFSAVVTAFLVESYKSLQADQNTVAVVALLTEISISVSKSNETTNNIVTRFLESSSPSGKMIAVNNLWFISLVMSLTTVLFGTTSLQWLRAHQSYAIQLDTKEKLAAFSMRTEGLKAWYVPQIIAALPILLQGALIIFWAGLAVFLLDVSPKSVYLSIMATMALPTFSIFLTAILPSFQWIVPPSVCGKLGKDIPSLCPYKSPQSRLFTTWLQPLWKCVIRWQYGSITKPWEFLMTHCNAFPFAEDKVPMQYREHHSTELYRHGHRNSNKHAEIYNGPDPHQTVLPSYRPDRPLPYTYNLMAGILAVDRETPEHSTQLACYYCIHKIAEELAESNHYNADKRDAYKYIQYIFLPYSHRISQNLFFYIRKGKDAEVKLGLELVKNETFYLLCQSLQWDLSSQMNYKIVQDMSTVLHGCYFSHLQSKLDNPLSLELPYRIEQFERTSSYLSLQYTKIVRLIFQQSVHVRLDETPETWAKFYRVQNFVDQTYRHQSPQDKALTISLVQNTIQSRDKGSAEAQHLLYVALASYVGMYTNDADFVKGHENRLERLDDIFIESLGKWGEDIEIEPWYLNSQFQALDSGYTKFTKTYQAYKIRLSLSALGTSSLQSHEEVLPHKPCSNRDQVHTPPQKK